jgi:hypothetical protein
MSNNYINRRLSLLKTSTATFCRQRFGVVFRHTATHTFLNQIYSRVTVLAHFPWFSSARVRNGSGFPTFDLGKAVRQGCCLSPTLFNLYSECLAKEALEGFGEVRIGQIINTVKYSDDLVLLAKE